MRGVSARSMRQGREGKCWQGKRIGHALVYLFFTVFFMYFSSINIFMHGTMVSHRSIGLKTVGFTCTCITHTCGGYGVTGDRYSVTQSHPRCDPCYTLSTCSWCPSLCLCTGSHCPCPSPLACVSLSSLSMCARPLACAHVGATVPYLSLLHLSSTYWCTCLHWQSLSSLSMCAGLLHVLMLVPQWVFAIPYLPRCYGFRSGSA
jgi:hypothetical protein